MKELTKKQRLAIEYFLVENNKTTAVFKAYECKSREVAGSMVSRVFNNKLVVAELEKRQVALTQRLVDRNVRLIDLIEKYVPKEIIAQKIAEGIISKDKRVADSSIEKYLKLAGEYAPERILQVVRNEIMDNRNQLIIPE